MKIKNQKPPLLSISIVIYILEPKILKELLSSLNSAIQNLPDSWRDVTIAIINNGDESELVCNIINEYDFLTTKIEYIQNEKNIGYGQAHNIAINNTNSKYHLILNPDVYLNENCLLEGIQFLEDKKNVSAVSPLVKNEKGQVQYLCKRYPSIFDLLIRCIGSKKINKYFSYRLNKYESRDLINQGIPVKTELISGCFMLCRSDLLKNIGGFDNRYFLYFEDFALSKELIEFGDIYYLPVMKIVHYGGNASRKGLKHIFLFISSAIKFFNQYKWKLY